MKKVILLSTVLLCFLQFNYAQHAGDFDPSFGTNGIVTADLGPKAENPSAITKVLMEPDGTTYFLLIKSGQYVISKRLADGSADMSYGDNGYSKPAKFGRDAAIQPDGKIVIMGGGL